MNHFRKKKCCISFFLKLVLAYLNILFCFNINAAERPSSDSTKTNKNFTGIASYQQGWILPTNSFVRGDNMKQMPMKYFSATSIQLFRQTTGENLWEQLYGYPRYGIGIYSLQFMDTKELGTPFSIFGDISIPLFRWKNFSLNSDIGLGLTFNWKTSLENSYNISFGGKVSSYVDGGLSVEYRTENGIILNVGTFGTHFSNGALKLPNYGINMCAPKISLGYTFTPSPKEFIHQDVPVYENQKELFLSFFTGWENRLYYGDDVDSLTARKGVYYESYGLATTYNWQFSHKSKIGIGVLIDYLGSAKSSISVIDGKLTANKASFNDGLELSIFPSYELVINRLAIIIQPGFYLYRTKYPFMTPFTYQRVGLKFNVSKDISLGINMHTHSYSTADFIEWTIGYRFNL